MTVNEHSTSVSLLERLRQPDQAAAWDRFVDLCTPMLYSWGRRVGLDRDAAADLVQDVLLVLVKKLPEFNYDAGGSFRGWLKTVTLNHWRASLRRKAVRTHNSLTVIGDVQDTSEPPGFEEEEYRQQLVARALDLMQTEFEQTTWRACWNYVVEGQPVEQVASVLGITVNAVYLAKSRVLRRLRKELQGLLE